MKLGRVDCVIKYGGFPALQSENKDKIGKIKGTARDQEGDSKRPGHKSLGRKMMVTNDQVTSDQVINDQVTNLRVT